MNHEPLINSTQIDYENPEIQDPTNHVVMQLRPSLQAFWTFGR